MAHLFVVDDEASARTTLALLLRRRGHRVEEADGVASATKRLAEQTFDLVVTDLRMPDGDGLDDDWEVAYFNDLSRDGAGDFDGDGANDADEFRAGTDPTNTGSVLRVISITTESTSPVPTQRTERFAAGSVRVPTNQPLGDLAVVLLEPSSPDSFFQWGFFDQVLQQTEYIEGYILEPMAEQMLASDPKLAEEFREKLATDETFRASPNDRLRWFYSRTPFIDERWKLYPVGREE